MTAALVVANVAVRQDSAGRFSLNDLHRAAGGNRRVGPGRWTRTEAFRGLCQELEPEMAFAPVQSVRGGVAPGTYVCEELVFAYAMWISPAFHLRVIRAYMQQTGRQLSASLDARRIAWEKRAAASMEKASIGGRWLGERRREKPLLAAEHAALERESQPALL